MLPQRIKTDDPVLSDQHHFISTPKEAHNIKIVTKSGLLWDTDKNEAIEKGNLIHNLLASVKTSEDIPFALSQFLDSGIINSGQARLLEQVLNAVTNHPILKPFFNEIETVYNERDIITTQQQVIRPDRLVIDSERKVTIIDYKTGDQRSSHHDQLEHYHSAIEGMGYEVTNKILVYINEDIEVVSI